MSFWSKLTSGSIETLPQPKYTVEDIHREVDEAEDKIIKQLNSELKEINVLTEPQLERKANLLKELGFTSSETFKDYSLLKKKEEKTLKENSEKQAKIYDILALKRKYPFNKFIPEEELERICKKYGLIFAPVSHYIKDVPEKNLLEIKNREPLKQVDKKSDKFKITILDWEENQLKYYSKEDRNKIYSSDKVFEMNRSYSENTLNNYEISRFILSKLKIHIGYHDLIIKKSKVDIINNSLLMCAAPKSHFDLKGLNLDNGGYYITKSYEIEDPIVFEFIRDGFVRIITKWGTPDDQSYLDPALVNEINN